MNAKQLAVGLQNVIFYLYNVPKTQTIEKVYGGKIDDNTGHGAYLESKLNMMCKDPLGWFADLDSEHREKFCQLVVEKYGE